MDKETREEVLSLLKIAEALQQDLYGSLPGWTKYQDKEYKYLRQNIGFSMFGPPSTDKDSQITELASLMDNVTDITHYSKEQLQTIHTIFSKIKKYEKTVHEKKYILFDIIYNVTISYQLLQEKQSRSKAANKEKNKYSDFEALRINAIFKTASTNDKEHYIDEGGRIYKDWKDYLDHNTLPKCIMVVPKDGSYQPDSHCEMTDNFSKVALETKESPACSLLHRLLFGADIASGVAASVALGIGITSMFTPVAPIAMGASALAMGINSVWSLGRASENLIDRKMHDESINLDNLEAVSSWLGIATGTVGGTQTVTKRIMVNAIQKGAQISQLCKVTHDVALIGNLIVGSVGTTFQGYFMFQKYKETESVNIIDATLFGAHLLFFANTIINIQFAESLIQSTQTKIMDDYRNNMRNKNLRKKYNKVIRRAVGNNRNKIEQNAEVIKYINNRVDLNKYKINPLPKNVSGNFNSDNLSVKIINDVTILEPKNFILKFIKEIINSSSRQYKEGDLGEFSMSQNKSTYNNKLLELKSLFARLLDELYNSDESPKHDKKFSVDNFIEIIKDLSKVNHCVTDILQQMFHVVWCIITRSQPCFHFLVDIFHLLWRYIYSNLQKNKCFVDSPIWVNKVIFAMNEIADKFVDETCNAFEKYIAEKAVAVKYMSN